MVINLTLVSSGYPLVYSRQTVGAGIVRFLYIFIVGGKAALNPEGALSIFFFIALPIILSIFVCSFLRISLDRCGDHGLNGFKRYVALTEIRPDRQNKPCRQHGLTRGTVMIRMSFDFLANTPACSTQKRRQEAN